MAEETRFYSAQNRNESKQENEEVEIDLGQVWQLAKKNMARLAALLIIAGAAAALVTMYLIPKTYTSTAVIYLTPMVSDQGSVDYNSLQTNSKLVSNVVALLKQDNIMSYVAEKDGFQDADALRKAVTITNETNTELIDVSATTHDPELSRKVADDVSTYFIETMTESLNVRNIQIVTKPKAPSKKSGPSVSKNTGIAAALAFVLELAWLLFRTVTDKRVKSKQEAEEFFGVPVLCQLPVLNNGNSKGTKKGK